MYTIVGGVNGVGKSSFTGVLKERTTDLGVIIDVYKMTAELGGNILSGGRATLKKFESVLIKNYLSLKKPRCLDIKLKQQLRKLKN